jgi:peptidoglycan/xylan/chitin deacetylase (PgdA/CDA1 family)
MKKYSRAKFISAFIVVFVYLVGCDRMPQIKIVHPEPRQPEQKKAQVFDDFILVPIKPGDTFASIAGKYLNDPSRSKDISAFNNGILPAPGHNIIIPLKSYKMGGIAKNGVQQVPVLVYHRFSLSRNDKMVIAVDEFEAQMKYLAENNYTVVTLDQLMDFLNMKQSLPEKSVAITIDDGWRSFKTYGFPVLKKYGFPATLFVYTDFIGKKKAMSWKDIRAVAAEGIDIQCHTRKNRKLTALRHRMRTFRKYFNQLEIEIAVSKNIIKEKVNKNCRYLAYPQGATDALIIEMVKKHGYRGAFTVTRGGNPVFINNYKINRSIIYGTYGIDQFIKNLEVFKELDLS